MKCQLTPTDYKQLYTACTRAGAELRGLSARLHAHGEHEAAGIVDHVIEALSAGVQDYLQMYSARRTM